MIVMGYVTGVSIAALFVGGIVPGILIGAALIAGSYSAARRYETGDRASLDLAGPGDETLGRALCRAVPALVMPMVVLGGILGGVFTATEAAGVAVAYGLIVGFVIYRELHFRDLPRILLDSALRSSVVMFVAAGAYLFAWLIAVGRVPEDIGSTLQTWATTPLAFMLAVNVVLIVMGMFMETLSAIIVVMPILFPIAMKLGLDPVHVGVVATVNLCIGMVTPPYGATLFVACSLSGLRVDELAPWTLRPIAMMLAVLALIVLVPGLVTFVPRLLGLV
jgi:C4-dicarboxylate transporter DctM subunit